MDRKKNRFNASRVLTASEIGQYHYCPVAWYLKRCGFEPESPALKEGINHHKEVGENIAHLPAQQHRSNIIQKIAILLILISILILLLGVIML